MVVGVGVGDCTRMSTCGCSSSPYVDLIDSVVVYCYAEDGVSTAVGGRTVVAGDHVDSCVEGSFETDYCLYSTSFGPTDLYTYPL